MGLKRYIYENLSFVRHLRNYYRFHILRTANVLCSAGTPGNAIFLDRSHYIVSPQSSSVTQAVWTNHTVFDEGFRENRIFGALRDGCHALLDLGSAEGYYSAIFCVTADQPSRIVAVDLSPAMCQLHEEVISLNKGLSQQPIDWMTHQIAITDTETKMILGDSLEGRLVTWYDSDPNRSMKTTTLQNFLKEIQFIPDLIKIDIESYEYEVIMSSLAWITKYQPRIHLELHSRMMRERGKSPELLMERLLAHYRVIDSVPLNWQNAQISRIGLVPME